MLTKEKKPLRQTFQSTKCIGRPIGYSLFKGTVLRDWNRLKVVGTDFWIDLLSTWTASFVYVYLSLLTHLYSKVILITNFFGYRLELPRSNSNKNIRIQKKCGKCHKKGESTGLEYLEYGLLGCWRIYHYLTPSPDNRSNGSDSEFWLLSFQINWKSWVYRVTGFPSSRRNWNWLPPPPYRQASVASPPHGSMGGTHSLGGEGAGEPIRTKRQTL